MKQDNVSIRCDSYLGLCIGSSSVSCALIEKTDGVARVVSSSTLPHNGGPQRCLEDLLRPYSACSLASFAVVRRTSSSDDSVPTLTEPEAVEYAYAHTVKNGPGFDAIISAGGETLMVYLLDRRGHISRVYSGNKCASGTGEFFLQQIRRMNLSLEEAIDLAATEQKPYRVSGRCSVFCKSDCTHALNKGTPKSRVVAGLCDMMAKKISDLLNLSSARRILFVGGVAQNRVIVSLLREEFPDLVVPQGAPYFEALGAALWSSERPGELFVSVDRVFPSQDSSFEFLSPLSHHESLVTFKEGSRGCARPGDECVVGLDVGSTTTKAIVLRLSDNAMLASVYLRTNGDPIRASRMCYAQLAEQIASTPITILGLGTTGSGRLIAGLHALTKSVINEITAHATAARFMDKEVDTVFEIGGQDAKYTYLVNGVATDYAMNEACSAGTGSFLEEAAGEHLKIGVREIAPLALRASRPLNFSDECAAFIASDINTAVHEGFGREDIVAGIVYSICMNYLNRVKQNRPAGRKILMQGGVCYNRAVPLAMAGLIGESIIVPPEPGLMGAVGVALEVKGRIALGLLEKQSFKLIDLANREITYKSPFRCSGGKEKCDRGCEIARIEVEGKTHPFGGACRKYENLRLGRRYDAKKYDHVVTRSGFVYKDRPDRPAQTREPVRTIGINNSLLTHIYFPLFSRFFSAIGMEVVLSKSVREEGVSKEGTAFCYPMEASHGLFWDLIERDPDYYFLPLINELPSRGDGERARTCVFVRSESDSLKAAFANYVDLNRILSPVLDLSEGLQSAESTFVSLARRLGVAAREARAAFRLAVEEQETCFSDFRALGRRALAEVESDPSQFGIVLFGRAYNALTSQLNMGIPHKFASQGIHVIPFDCLPYQDQPKAEGVYWGLGQDILQAAHFVREHPQLFGAYITNFSCGPDSFILGYFRDLMGSKPSLTLELDSHTADVGIDTRIEAFLDIVRGYRELQQVLPRIEIKQSFIPASINSNGSEPTVTTSSGATIPLRDSRVYVLIPEMGKFDSAGLAAVMRRFGIRASVQPTDRDALKKGRECGTCKECLPYHLTTGSLLEYLENGRSRGEVVLFFMPRSHGPCRFGQYTVAVEKLIRKRQLRDVAVFSLDDGTGFGELGNEFRLAAWRSAVIGGIFEDIRNVLLTLGADKRGAIETLQEHYGEILHSLEHESFGHLRRCLARAASVFRSVPLTKPLPETPKVCLLGEVFVRENSFCRRGLVEKLSQKGFVVTVPPLTEYLHYCDYEALKGYSGCLDGLKEKIECVVCSLTKRWIEYRIRRILSASGLIDANHPSVSAIVEEASHYLCPHVATEAVLSVGLAMHEIVDRVCGVICIGPFACMPCRVAEGILEASMDLNSKRHAGRRIRHGPGEDGLTHLPWLAIESDGHSMPHIVEAKLNTFCLQALRVHERVQKQRH